MATASATLDVTALPDNDIWFANSQAWSNYWKGQTVDITFDAAATTIYAASAYDNTLQPYVLNVDGVDNVLATNAMFTSLLARVNALNASYEALRTQMRDAGFITNAQ